jgi:predicted permease
VFAAFGLVLAAACANVSNIMLARANTRHREIGVRLSLGATRGRVVRQLLTEGALIAVIAGLAGLGLAALLLRLGTTLLFVMLPPTAAALVRVVPLVFDRRVFLFTLAVGAATTMMFALMPALQATRLTLTHALRGEPSQGLRRSTLRSVLVAGQVTISLILLIVAGTLVRNGMALGATDLGFVTEGVFSVNQRARGAKLIEPAATALRADSRIATVAVTSRNPLFGQLPKTPATAAPSPAVVGASYMFVSPEYFDLLNIPIVRGRGFRPEEAKTEAAIAVVSAATAKAFWPGEDPLGKTMRVRLDGSAGQAEEIARMKDIRRAESVDRESGVDLTVVGVAKDVVSGFIFEGTDRAHVYMPTHDGGRHAGSILLRGHGQRALRLDEVQAVLRPVHQDPLALESLPLAEMVSMQMFPIVVASWIGSVLSTIALVLSVSGLYGVVSYGLSQRTREIGIRMALGATAGAVVRLVMAQSARMVAIGTIAGMGAAFAALAILRALVRLDNVTIVDAGVFASAVAIVGAAAAFAAFVPARRAASIEPAATLRADG